MRLSELSRVGRDLDDRHMVYCWAKSLGVCSLEGLAMAEVALGPWYRIEGLREARA